MILIHPILKCLFILFFSEDHNVDITGLDIAVNAVATAVKDFFFKRLPPVLPEEQMTGMVAHSCYISSSIISKVKQRFFLFLKNLRIFIKN